MELTPNELIESAKALQKQTQQLFDSRQKGGKFDASIAILNRNLKQALLQIGGVSAIVTNKEKEGRTIGQVRKYTKPEPKVEQKDNTKRKIGEIRNKPKVVTNDEVNKENETFIQGVAKMNREDFDKRYDKPNALKSIGKVINELEGEEIISLKGNDVKTLQGSIWDFLHKD